MRNVWCGCGSVNCRQSGIIALEDGPANNMWKAKCRDLTVVVKAADAGS